MSKVWSPELGRMADISEAIYFERPWQPNWHERLADALRAEAVERNNDYEVVQRRPTLRVLTLEQAREILTLARRGIRQSDIASAFGVTQAHVSAIKCGRRWAALS